MSRVTNAILHMGTLDEDERDVLLAQVNSFFAEDGPGYPQRGFVHCDDPALPDGWYGGSKRLEADLAIGAFNHLVLGDLIAHLRRIRWPDPGVVQLIVCEQDDFKFRIVDLFPE